MTKTLKGVDARVQEPAAAGGNVDEGLAQTRELTRAEQALVGDLARQARTEGVALTGPDGLLTALTKMVLETALDEKITEHLGYDKHAAAGRGSGNSGNGSRTKKVITDACRQVEIEVPRDLRSGGADGEYRRASRRTRSRPNGDFLGLSLNRQTRR